MPEGSHYQTAGYLWLKESCCIVPAKDSSVDEFHEWPALWGLETTALALPIENSEEPESCLCHPDFPGSGPAPVR
jgi:hypothetical protein